MPDDKRYYWIKLKTDFFDIETIDWLKSQENGCEYIVLYQQLCLMTANKDGEMAVKIGEMLVPFDAKKIARDTKTDIDTVLVALELFSRIGLIYLQENGIFRIPAVSEMVGSECDSAQRVRKHREKQKALQSNEDVTDNVTDKALQSNEELELRVKSLEIDSDTDTEKDSSSTTTAPEIVIVVENMLLRHWKRKPTDKDIEIALGYISDADSVQMLSNALEMSARKGERACNWSYIKAIYESWERNGITNELELVQHEVARKNGEI